MCLVLLCWFAFLFIWMVLVLSQNILIWSQCKLIKERVCFIQRTCARHSPATILRLGDWEGYKILFLGRSRNEIIFKKLTSSSGAFPIYSTTDIVGIRITRRWELYGLRIPQAHSSSALKISNIPQSNETLLDKIEI